MTTIKINDTVTDTNGITHKVTDICGDTLITDKGMITIGQIATSGIPHGVDELRKAQDAAYNERARYEHEFNRMMDTGDSISPEPINKTILTKAQNLAVLNPAAAVYLQAESFMGSSNHNKYGAGKDAKELLEAGGTIADAKEILKTWSDRFVPVWGK